MQTAGKASSEPNRRFATVATTRGILARAAYALGHLGKDIDAAIALVDRSLQISPSFAYGWQRFEVRNTHHSDRRLDK